MVLFPNAKINLGLYITEKRSDGYHNIETIFMPISLCDILEFIESEKETTFKSSGIKIPGNEKDNLCVKAWNLINKEFNIPAVEIYLHKQIPIGAGLGGGSADAAFMLRGLNEYFKLGLTSEKLMHFASELGSDCAFFIRNEPCYATGRGEILTPLILNLEHLKILLINPGIHVGTAEAYSMVIPAMPKHSLPDSIKLPVKDWKKFISNDFEKGVFEKHPKIAAIKRSMLDAGAIYAAMSGSGSSVFAIFENEIPAILDKDFKEMFMWKSHE